MNLTLSLVLPLAVLGGERTSEQHRDYFLPCRPRRDLRQDKATDVRKLRRHATLNERSSDH